MVSIANTTEQLNFIYLIGAGASSNALPTTEKFRDFLLTYPTKFNSNDHHVFGSVFHQIMDEAIWLGNEIRNFKSPDTRAKVAYLSQDHETYKRIKNVLSIIFYIEELIDNNHHGGTKRDPRYINFIASVLKDNLPVFPKNVKIISWNYDFQFELAANEIVRDKWSSSGARTTVPLLKYYPPPRAVPDREFDLIHLNGIAYVDFLNEDIKSYFHHPPKHPSIESVWNYLRDSNVNPFIKFAWESEINLDDPFIDHLEKTDILVVIGYSFPFFNRNTDSRIFDALKKGGQLKKIYFQSPDLDGQFLYNQFGLMQPKKKNGRRIYSPKEIEIEHIPNCDQFYIPFEF